jgi:hypothetical protein
MNRMRLLAVVAAAVLASVIPVAAQVNPEPPAPAPEMNPPAEAPPSEAATDEAAAADAAEPMEQADPDGAQGEVQLGLIQKDVDTISSKFTEYRDVPNGIVVPFFSIRGHRGDLRYSAAGRNVQQGDQQFAFGLDHRKWSLDADYNQIPHRFGNDGRTLLEETRPGV